MEEKKYLLIALRYWKNNENVLFWGKDRSGYEVDLSKVGLYTMEEAKRVLSVGDCYISMDSLGITKEMMDFKNENAIIVVKKTAKICDYINTFDRIMKNKKNMRCGY